MGVGSVEPAEGLLPSFLVFLGSLLLELDLLAGAAVLGLSALATSLATDLVESLSILVSFCASGALAETLLMVLTRERGSLASAFSLMVSVSFFTCLAMMSLMILSSSRVFDAERLSLE